MAVVKNEIKLRSIKNPTKTNFNHKTQAKVHSDLEKIIETKSEILTNKKNTLVILLKISLF